MNANERLAQRLFKRQCSFEKKIGCRLTQGDMAKLVGISKQSYLRLTTYQGMGIGKEVRKKALRFLERKDGR